MKKSFPNASAEGRETTREPGFNREDSTRRHNQNGASDVRFAKDKRKRITRIEKNPRENARKENDGEYQERKSFNPNFTRDNKLKDNRGDRGNPNREHRPDRYERRQDDSGGGRKEYRDHGSKFRDGNREGNREGRDNRFPGKGKGYGQGGRYPSKGNRFHKKSDNEGYRGGEYPTFPAPEHDTPIRLNRYLAMSGLSSRREADELIKEGKVTVNGVVVTELGTKVLPTDVVKYNENVVQGQNKVYILMNKPKGYVTTLDDPHADKTVMDLLKNAVTERVYPVGRLDKNSLGVLLITNDGDMTKKLTHPTYNKKKIYHVTLDKSLTQTDMEQIAQGIELEDGEIHADEISYVGATKRDIGVEIHSGRNRIVRRIFEHMGYKVVKLDRVYFAGLTKKNLRRGAWRFLTPKEVQILKSGMYE